MARTGTPLEARASRLLPHSFVTPAYGGRSIANLPATLGWLLGVEQGWASPPLGQELLEAAGAADRVVLLLVDGVGRERLERELSSAGVSIAEAVGREPLLDETLTSIAPATTSAATTVLLGNGAGPAETGMLGYTFLLPGFGLLANMLLFQPVADPTARPGDLERWGLVPEEFLPTPSLAQVLAAGGSGVDAFMPAHLVRTPLSRMQLRGARVEGFINWTDAWHKLGRWLGDDAVGRRLAYCYLSDFDALSHRDGTSSGLWSSVWERLTGDLSDFLAGQAGRSGGRTLLLVTADHGHVDCPITSRHFVQDYPGLSDLCLMGGGGEARHANLYARGGAKEELLAYCREELGDAFAVLDAAEALAAGLYGPTERLHPETPARLGDVLLLSRGANHLWDRESKGSMVGMHGSLEPHEALVPLLAFEL